MLDTFCAREYRHCLPVGSSPRGDGVDGQANPPSLHLLSFRPFVLATVRKAMMWCKRSSRGETPVYLAFFVLSLETQCAGR